MNVPHGLITAAEGRKLIPFIGAGFSKNLGLPDWSEVIDIIAEELRMDPDVCKVYGDYLQIAEYYVLKKGTISSLRSKLDRMFNAYTIDVTESRIHMLLPNLDIRFIYTTNWDELIERAYDKAGKRYNKVTSMDDLLKMNESLPTIIKYHGDFSSKDEDIVLSESSYFERLAFESPLDIKLRADVLSNTILFIGYSFSDINLRYLWFKLSKLYESVPLARNQTIGYIVTTNPNPIFQEISKLIRRIEVIPLEPRDPSGSLQELIEKLISVQ